MPRTETTPETETVIPGDARLYHVDQQASQVDIAVYRAGPLAHLGHNHVISTARIKGRLWRHPELAQSGFSLQLPVDSLEVDHPRARSRAVGWAGSGFDTEIGPDARMATRRNMLGSEVLDSTHHPLVQIVSVALAEDDGKLQVTAALTLLGQTREIRFPASWSEEEGRLRASGVFAVSQSDFGIAPFSIALGALRVKDEIRVRFELAAVAE